MVPRLRCFTLPVLLSIMAHTIPAQQPLRSESGGVAMTPRVTAQPGRYLGVYKGMSGEAVERLGESRFHSANGPNRDWGTYEVFHPIQGVEVMQVAIGPTGVCSLGVLTTPTTNDRSGSAIRREFQQRSNALAPRFGQGITIDSIVRRSPWTATDEYLIAIARHDRALKRVWNRHVPNTLPDDVALAVVAVNADDASSAHLTIVIAFSNQQDCP